MIVDPDFFDHWKTRILTDELDGDECAPLYILRLWAHCQQRRKTHLKPIGNPSITQTARALKGVCRYPGEGEKLAGAMESAGFISIGDDGSIEVLGWREHNSQLVANWENGSKGGRPKKKPIGNPSETHRKPKPEMGKPIRVDKSREDSAGDGARIGSAVPPAPKPSGLDEVVGYAESRNCDPREAEKFFDHFTANGWKVGGKAPMKDWRAAFRNWCRNAPAMARTGQARGSPAQDREQRTIQAMREFSEGP